MSDFDCLIIGAGVSGIAAGIRLAHYGLKVKIFERHFLPGGLNSFYRRDGYNFDVGLHAMTNFVDKKQRKAPLNKLLRQLRIPREALELCEQSYSSIAFPEVELKFSNNFADLVDSIAANFPDEVDGFRKLVEKIDSTDAMNLNITPVSTKEVLAQYIKSPLLRDMIICPLMYYGNPCEDDMEFHQFCIMFQSVFQEGFCRPAKGVRTLFNVLLDRYKETGGEIELGCAVKNIVVKNNKAVAVELGDGQVVTADRILSSAGYAETLALCEQHKKESEKYPAGELGYVESIFVMNKRPADLGLGSCITFFNQEDSFEYKRVSEPVSCRSGVLCAPDNFVIPDAEKPLPMLRLTLLADHKFWRNATNDEYSSSKINITGQMRSLLDKFCPGASGCIEYTDVFTPATIYKYTGHINGTVYGSPAKVRDGVTPVDNVYICGTDQGFLGIVGAMLSGVSMANLHCLK